MNIKLTVTSIFMVPTLGCPKDVLLSNGFINGYINDAQRDIEYKDSVFLLFQPQNLSRFKSFLDGEYERTKHIIEDYNLDEGFVVVVYKLDPLYKSDFDLIRKGQYSKTSPAFQKLFSKIKKVKIDGLSRDEISLQYRVFNKTQDLILYWEEKFGIAFDKDQELWTGFVEEDETLNSNKLREIIKI